MDERPYIVHIMNSVYGRSDQYGVRSRWIATSEAAEYPMEIYSRAGKGERRGGVDAIHPLRLPVKHQIPRALMKLLGRYEQKKQSIWRGFDEAVAGAVETRGVARKVAIVHAWDWTPKAVAVLKERHPEALVVRDVVVNRYHEFYSATPITEQEKVTDAFFSPSTFTTSKLVEWGIPEDKIYEIPFGVDTDAFRPSKHEQPELSPQGGTPSAPVRFAFSGAVSRRKGADTLLRAWKQLRLENAELHLYGKVRDVQRELEDTKGVIAHGHVPLVEELPKNSVYVFPSTLEGSAKSVYEALACGLPVITTPDSGSIVRDGIDGFIVPPGDDQALNQAMRRLYDDPELRRELGQNARKRAEDHTWEAYGRRVWQVYRALLKNSNR